MDSIITWIVFGGIGSLVVIEIIVEIKRAFIESGIF